mmetsp:Transcript_19206/g.37321  ORF Transcript_19206/g.37321 Transcript_19206/m.37321 type:complete len:334 (+) Transcript_19206:356-1357(+)
MTAMTFCRFRRFGIEYFKRIVIIIPLFFHLCDGRGRGGAKVRNGRCAFLHDQPPDRISHSHGLDATFPPVVIPGDRALHVDRRRTAIVAATDPSGEKEHDPSRNVLLRQREGRVEISGCGWKFHEVVIHLIVVVVVIFGEGGGELMDDGGIEGGGEFEEGEGGRFDGRHHRGIASDVVAEWEMDAERVAYPFFRFVDRVVVRVVVVVVVVSVAGVFAGGKREEFGDAKDVASRGAEAFDGTSSSSSCVSSCSSCSRCCCRSYGCRFDSFVDFMVSSLDRGDDDDIQSGEEDEEGRSHPHHLSHVDSSGHRIFRTEPRVKERQQMMDDAMAKLS